MTDSTSLRERSIDEMGTHERMVALAWAFGGHDQARLERHRESVLYGYAPPQGKACQEAGNTQG